MEQNGSSADDSGVSDCYQIERWGESFFSIDPQGRVAVRDNEHEPEWPICDLIEDLTSQGVSAPMLLRFPGIIGAKAKQLNNAFQRAIDHFDYGSRYHCVYPVKVNQDPIVIDSILRFGEPSGIGLEAGSKAELLMVIAKSGNQTPIFYNGFKDRGSIEMAIRASRMGRKLTIIIEKPNEIDLIHHLAQELQHLPRLGIRVKLASRGSGHWEHSGGLKSKFGLFVPQLLAAVDKLEQLGILDCFKLLHFHPGSQINDILKIKASVIEATRIYCDLKRQGVPLTTIDVGGGLAVDYTGNQSTEPSSMNYSLQEYANDIVYYIKRICDQMDTAVPEIVSESGRALVAHHSMLVIPVIGSSYRDIRSYRIADMFDPGDRSLQPLVELKGTLEEVDQDNLLESFHDAQQAMDMTLQLFASGMITLRHRAIGESLFWSVCQKIRDLLNNRPSVPVELESLRDLFAETYVANFSLFQSLRDHWAIQHLFPVVPLSGHLQKPSLDAVIGDITCDSDGKISRFVGDKHMRSTLPVHPLRENKPYLLGAFLVGAYQEAIGEQHNLLGQPNVVTIESSNGRPVIVGVARGDSIGSTLESNDPNWRQVINEFLLDHSTESSDDLDFFRQSLSGSCYLEPSRQDPVPAAFSGTEIDLADRDSLVGHSQAGSSQPMNRGSL